MKKELFDNIKLLCNLNGVSGRENAVSDEIMNQLGTVADEIQIDNLGNILGFKKGKSAPKNKVMLTAHMDEVGMIVTAITTEGLLRFSTVGGINPKVLIGRQVIITPNNIRGVIATKAVHMQDDDEKGKVVPTDKLYIDIGAIDEDDALQHISLGDSVNFVLPYREIGANSILSKAIDDRIGCAILIDIINSVLEYDIYFAFLVQEEMGLRGATVAAYSIAPDIAIVVETTASGDVSGVTDEKRVTLVGGGAVVSYMDSRTIYDKGLYDLSFALAREQNIKVQTKTLIAGGNDAGAIQISGAGVRTIAISVASKYIHSPSGMADKDDIIAVSLLTKALANATPCI